MFPNLVTNYPSFLWRNKSVPQAELIATFQYCTAVKKMKFGIKLIIIAVLALTVGIAFASPLLYENLVVKPFPRIPEGPKADFRVDVVYANFSVQEHASTKSSGDTSLSIVTYDVVLNVTNLSDLQAIVRASKRESQHQRAHVDWQKLGATADVLLLLFYGDLKR
jgi:hypothetical protein